MAHQTFQGYGPKTALTKLGLQWWTLDQNGGLKKVETYGKIHDSEIANYKKWGTDHQVKILLCVYNGVQGWDWELAKKGFIHNRQNLIQQLIQTAQKHQLDGVDLDLEGTKAPKQEDRHHYKIFVQELSKELKKQGLLLTIDTFHSPLYNTPNLSWWKDWVGLVDGIHSMGYEDLYEGSEKTLAGVKGKLFRYSWQQSYGVQAGYSADQVCVGLPTNLDQWGKGGRGTYALDHVRECLKDCPSPASMALWDLQLLGTDSEKGWRSKALWKTLTEVSAKNQK